MTSFAVADAIMLVARPLRFAQELTHMQLACDAQGHAQMHHVCIHTNTHSNHGGRSYCHLAFDLQHCRLRSNMLLLCRVMSEVEKVLCSSEVGSKAWLAYASRCPQHLPLHIALYHVPLQVGRMHENSVWLSIHLQTRGRCSLDLLKYRAASLLDVSSTKD